MAVKIDRNLNLVVPVERDDGTTIHVHSMPVSRAVFEQYHLVIAKAFAALMNEGLGTIAGPRVAALLLADAAKAIGTWDGPAGVENGLMAEIRRLSNVVAPVASRGWETIPYEDAVKSGLLSEDDVAEVENAIVFFILASSMHRRAVLPLILDAAGELWGAQTTSLNATAYAGSLQTSTPAETSEVVVGLSVPR